MNKEQLDQLKKEHSTRLKKSIKTYEKNKIDLLLATVKLLFSTAFAQVQTIVTIILLTVQKTWSKILILSSQ